MKTIFDEFMAKRFPSADKAYRQEWQNRFTRGYEYEMMDSGSRRIYNQIRLKHGLNRKK